MTTAEEVAKLLGDSGDQFHADDGQCIDDLCLARGSTMRSGNTIDDARTAYDFPDRSSIVVVNAWWDLGIDPSCFCWDGCGHKEPCPLA